jgi:hypothetical protein
MIKNLQFIFKEIIFYLTKGSQVYLKNHSSYSRSILLLPVFINKDDFVDQISRLRWYVPEKYLNKKITVLIDEKLKGSVEKPIYPSAHRIMPSPDVLNNINVEYVNNKFKVPKSDIYCIWKFSFKKHLKLLLTRPFYIRIIDPYFYKYAESHTYPALLWYDIYTTSQRADLKNHSEQLFKQFYNDNNSDKVLLFGTGPSINSVFDKDYKNEITIICNSIVKDDKLLEKIQPNAITFIDSVFHFGVSIYCEKFIEDVIKTVTRFGSYCFINEVGGALIYEHYPNLREKLICFPTYRIGNPNRIKPDKFKSKFYSQSVVTRIMLQLGAGLADKILMCGFDGRSTDEDYFWKHSSSTQYDDLMQYVWNSHPAFFSDTNYEDHYNDHCKVMERVINKLEKKGTKIFSLEKSYIPALSIRKYNRDHF